MPTSGSPEQKPCTSEEGGKWGEVRRKRKSPPPSNGALYGLLQSSHNAPLILALWCVFHHPSVPSAPSWGNQIVNLYGLEEPHMENCVAGLKSCLCLSPPPPMGAVGRSTWRLAHSSDSPLLLLFVYLVGQYCFLDAWLRPEMFICGAWL